VVFFFFFWSKLRGWNHIPLGVNKCDLEDEAIPFPFMELGMDGIGFFFVE
jgi:hypothetical protein